MCRYVSAADAVLAPAAVLCKAADGQHQRRRKKTSTCIHGARMRALHFGRVASGAAQISVEVIGSVREDPPETIREVLFPEGLAQQLLDSGCLGTLVQLRTAEAAHQYDRHVGPE